MARYCDVFVEFEVLEMIRVLVGRTVSRLTDVMERQRAGDAVSDITRKVDKRVDDVCL